MKSQSQSRLVADLRAQLAEARTEAEKYLANIEQRQVEFSDVVDRCALAESEAKRWHSAFSEETLKHDRTTRERDAAEARVAEADAAAQRYSDAMSEAQREAVDCLAREKALRAVLEKYLCRHTPPDPWCRQCDDRAALASTPKPPEAAKEPSAELVQAYETDPGLNLELPTPKAEAAREETVHECDWKRVFLWLHPAEEWKDTLHEEGCPGRCTEPDERCDGEECRCDGDEDIETLREALSRGGEK